MRLPKQIGWRVAELRRYLRTSANVLGRSGDPSAFDALNDSCRWRRLWYAYDEIVGWRFLKNHVARVLRPGGYYVFRTNSIGIRSDREYPRAVPPGRKRIVLMGDSFTAGDGVDNAQRFSDVIEARFPHLDVMNFGLSGSGTDQQLLLYETRARDYQADAYVFCVYVENIFRNRLGCWPALEWSSGRVCYRAKPYYLLQNGELVLRNVPVPRDIRSEETLGDWREPGLGYLTDGVGFEQVYASADSSWWLLLACILGRFRSLTGDKPFFIVPLPTSRFIEGELPQMYMSLFGTLDSETNRCGVIDALPRFLALAADERRRCTLPRDHHYTALGHRTVADAIIAGIEAHCPSLLRPESY